jgi:hypothetical protein
MWIADLLTHGPIRGGFVPPEPIQHPRDLMRTRKQLVREIAQLKRVNRLLRRVTDLGFHVEIRPAA